MKKTISLLLLPVLSLLLAFSAACKTPSDSGNSSGNSSGGGNVTPVSEREDNNLYLGLFGIAPDQDPVNVQRFYDALNSDNYNVFLFPIYSDESDLDRYCNAVYEKGKKFWFYAMDIVWTYSGTGYVMRKDAYKRLNDVRARCAGKTWYDAMLGFHIDEPLLAGMSLEDLENGSKAFNFVFPEKRFYVNFAGFAFNEDIPSIQPRMTREAGKYITDVSFDLYGQLTDAILETYENMVEMFKGENKYFWTIPMCMFYVLRSTEDQCIEHIEKFYELMKKTDGGCGMLLYTANTFSWDLEQLGNIGFLDMTVSVEEFKTWKNRKKPWSLAYAKFYDENDNPINGGYKPWTKLLDTIGKVGSDVKARNAENAGLIDTELSVDENRVFEYNGGEQYPAVYPSYLKYNYKFIEKDTQIVSAVAPSAVGKYRMEATLPASKYRAEKTIFADFEIVPSTKTLISEARIKKVYSPAHSYISVAQSGLSYSLDGVNYQPYEKNSEIDVTNLVVRSKHPYCVYFKEGDKSPFIVPIATYKEKALFLFENEKADNWSHFVIAGNKKHSGNQSAYIDGTKTGTKADDGYRYFFYTNTCELGASPDMVDAKYLEAWIYAEEDIDDIRLSFSARDWAGNASNTVCSAKAHTWTKLVFDLGDMANDVKLESVIMLTFTTQKPASFYMDDIYLITL